MKKINRRKALKESLIWSLGFFSVSSIEFFLNSCSERPKAKFSLDINPFQKQVIAEIAEIFIPKSDTPGAKDLHLDDFIIYMIKNCTVPPYKKSFVDGLNVFIEKTERKYRKSFLELGASERIQLVKEEDESAFTLMSLFKRKLLNYVPTFFQMMKDLTVFGYCTSEEGATQELNFLPVPGQYIPCQTLKPGQKAWAIAD